MRTFMGLLLTGIAILVLGAPEAWGQPPLGPVAPANRPKPVLHWPAIDAQASDSAERKLVIEMYNAGLDGVNATSHDLDMGRSATQFPLSMAKQRALNAGMEISASDPKLRLELMKAFCDCSKQMAMRVRALSDAAARGAEFEHLDAELRMLRLQQPSPKKSTRIFSKADLSSPDNFAAKADDTPEVKLLAPRFVAAANSVKAVMDAYQAGQLLLLEDLFLARRRFLEAGMDLPADGATLRLEFARIHLESSKAIEAQILGLANEGARGGEADNLAAAQLERLHAELRLLRLEQGPTPSARKKGLTLSEKASILKGEKIAVQADEARERKLLIEQYNAGVQAVKCVRDSFSVGRTRWDVYTRTHAVAMQAAWELAPEDSEIQLETANSLLAAVKYQEAHILARAKAGSVGGEASNVARARYERAAAELRLLRLQKTP